MPDDKKVDGSYQPDLDELILLSTAAKQCGLSAGHLRLLVRTGELWGKKLDLYWYTTDTAVREYLALGKKPGPK
ncbi:MAG: hypothetical protein AAF614_41570 [Chloroflexota bacterium]